MPATFNIQHSTFNIQNFIQLCSDHLIIPAIYLKLKAHDILNDLPEDFIQAFKEIYDLNRQRNLQILQLNKLTTLPPSSTKKTFSLYS
ncbi:MAG TPA: hypothetical protein DCR40_19260 [Prolixibacteraceae bacterium]|nr:hypothetical protein [Prolixibacteraceae bacterium]